MSSPYFFPHHQIKPTDISTFYNYTILLGTLSSGNLPQLTLETILTSFDTFVPFGVFHDPASIEPFVTTISQSTSSSPSQSTTMSDEQTTISSQQSTLPQFQFAIELYINHTIKTILIIQRARIIEHRSYTFIKSFFTFLQQLQPQNIICLTSLGPSHRPAEHKDLIQWFTVESNQVDENGDEIKSTTTTTYESPNTIILQKELNLPPTHLSPDELEADLQYLKIKYGEKNKKSLFYPFPIKGAGVTRQIAKYARKNKLPLVGIVGFTGPDSIESLATVTLQFIKATHTNGGNNEWVIPKIVAPQLEEFC